MAIQVIIDTNFLFIPSEFRLDIFKELNNLLGQRVEPILLSPAYQELQRLAKSKSPKLRKNATLGLKLVQKCQIVGVERRNGEPTDDLIARIAIELGCPVATNDGELRRKLRNAGVAVIFVRQKHRLDIEGYV